MDLRKGARRRGWVAWTRLGALVLVGVPLVVLALFAINGLDPSWREPRTGTAEGLQLRPPVREVRILTFNIANAFFWKGGLRFASTQEVRERLDRIAALIEQEECDLVFLSEVVMEGGPVPIDQVEHLARAAAFPFWISGDKLNLGLPFWRIRSGNALLSRLPLVPIKNEQLAGARPFYRPYNNRRILWCELVIDGRPLLTASVRNDSFDIENNLVQTRAILASIGERPALLAGDFNADPHTAPMELLRQSGRFSGNFDGPPTFPSHAPRRRIDYVLAPADWELVEERVIGGELSDHLAVLSVFRLP